MGGGELAAKLPRKQEARERAEQQARILQAEIGQVRQQSAEALQDRLAVPANQNEPEAPARPRKDA